MRQKKDYTIPEEGLELLRQAEQEYKGYDNIPVVDFTIDIDATKYKTKLKSIRLTEYIIEGFEILGKEYKIKPQTLIKAVLEEFLNKKCRKQRRYAE